MYGIWSLLYKGEGSLGRPFLPQGAAGERPQCHDRRSNRPQRPRTDDLRGERPDDQHRQQLARPGTLGEAHAPVRRSGPLCGSRSLPQSRCDAPPPTLAGYAKAACSGSRAHVTNANTLVVVQHWLLVRGTGDRPLGARVGAESLRGHSSTRRPSVQKGDLAVCYAAVWQSIFAVVEVSGDPDDDPTRDRWRWRFPIRPLIVLDDLRTAPPVEAGGVFPRSLGRHSYVRLTPDQFRAAQEAIEAGKQRASS
jgi:hypothetical protein